MRWALPAMISVAGVLWVDALVGGRWAGETWALAVIAGLALLSGLAARALVLAGATPGVVVLLAVADQVGSPGQFALADDGVFYAVVVGAPALAGAMVAVRSAAVRELEARRAQLLERREIVVLAARSAEVGRVEQEVDEALAHRLRAVIDGIADASARASSRPDAVPSALEEVGSSARAALGLLRDVLGVLRPPEPTPAMTITVPPARPRQRRVMDQVDVLLVLAAVPLVVETSLPGLRGPGWLNVVLALAQGVSLTAARRRPIRGAVVLLTVACLQSAVLTPLPPTVSWLLPGLSLALLVGHAPDRRTAWVGLLVIVTGVVLLTLVTPAPDRSLDGFVPGLVMGILAWLAGRALSGRDARAAELRAIGEELDRTRDQAAALATSEQRAELARELHDVGAHALTVVCLQAGAAQTWWDRDRERALVALAALDDLAGTVMTSLCTSFGGPARPGPDLPLDALADLGRVLGLTVGVRVDGSPRLLTGEVSQVAFRVVQESLTNAARHASHARVEVGLIYEEHILDVQVNNTGPGHAGDHVVAVPGSGFGLSGMAERVRAVRGELSAGPSEDGGFTVHARLPLVAQP